MEKEKKKSPSSTRRGLCGEVWYQEGPRKNGSKQIGAVPHQRLSFQ